MSHSRLHHSIARLFTQVREADRRGLSLDDLRGERARLEERRLSRRQALGGLAALGAAASASFALPARARTVSGAPEIAIVGAGLAGLVCAERLTQRGFTARLYEAHPHRLGGRCYTDRTTFPGQVAEPGGEMIDTLHKTMLGYAQAFGLAREDLEHAPGDTAFHFFGQHHTEDAVVAEYREMVERMRPDFRGLSGGPTFFAHTPADLALDQVDLETYLGTRAADLPLAREVLSAAYVAEYGLEPSQQSTLNFLFFIHLDRRRHLHEFGVYSDERYHLLGGNDQLVYALADHVTSRGCTIHQGAALTGLARGLDGRYALTINGGATPEYADAVVLAMPFSVLRRITLDASLGLSADKRRAIQELGYGDNVKTAIRFDRRVWAEQGASGLAYSDLPNVQNTWETNYSVAGQGGILTDYAGGARGLRLQLNPSGNFGCGGCHSGPPADSVLNPTGAAHVEAQMQAFVDDLDQVFPGARAAVSRRGDGTIVGQRAHWTPQAYSRGSYTCYKPGQFCGLAGLEGQPAGALKFAGEHTDSFYEWQGFMEGACNSGLRAADELLDDIRAGRI